MNRIDQPEILFHPNGLVDVEQLIALYRLVGWDTRMARTVAKTQEMLTVSRFYVAASTPNGVLAGFARVAGDPYVAQVLDVITHPDFRRRGHCDAVCGVCYRASPFSRVRFRHAN